jgi:hypothetical protein
MAGVYGITLCLNEVHSDPMIIQFVPLGWFGKPVDCGHTYDNGHQEQKEKPSE